MSDEEIWAYVRDAHTAVLTTLKKDGSPISLPLWFAEIDGALYFPTRGKKVERIRRNPVSSVLIETGEVWRDLKGVHFSGTTEVVEPEEEFGQQIRAEIGRKYDAFRSTPPARPAPSAEAPSGEAPPNEAPSGAARRAPTPAILVFRPSGRILNWDNSKLFDD